MAQKVKSSDEFDEIIKRGGKTVVFVMTEWVSPAKIMGPIFDQFKSSYPDITFIKVDVDEIPILISGRSLPRLMFYMKGNLCEAIDGFQNEQRIKSFLDKCQDYLFF